jgi:DNA replication protein DnaC
MVVMYTAGWRDEEAAARFQRKVQSVDVLVLDDAGKEFMTKTNLSQSVFDMVLRQRVTSLRPTLLTTNLKKNEIGAENQYGGAILSLLTERSYFYEFTSPDYRARAKDRRVEEMTAGERRPIF